MNNENWLREVLSAQDPKIKSSPPVYEKNVTTESVLTVVRELNEQADSRTKVQIELLNSLTAEYEAQSDALKKILGNIGLDIVSLPDDLRELAKSAVAAQKQKQKSVLNEQAELHQISSPPSFHQTSAIQLLQNLKKLKHRIGESTPVEKQELHRKNKEAEFLLKKEKEYTTKTTHLERCLGSVGYTSTISHGALVQRSKELDGLQAKLKEIRLKLSGYGDIAPDINLARVQVEKAKQELANLESQIATKLSGLQL